MKITPELIALITQKVGRYNVDVLSGWESGMKGFQRVGGMLAPRHPPEHLTGQRYRDWVTGEGEAAIYRKHNKIRSTTFAGNSPNGFVHIQRKGWIGRTPVISRMEKLGVAGNITVHYLEDGKIIRSVLCGI